MVNVFLRKRPQTVVVSKAPLNSRGIFAEAGRGTVSVELKRE